MNDEATADQTSVLIIGGPDAGKSNFLFRLWIAIDHGTGVLMKDGLPSDLDYLRVGAERLLEGEFAAHTSQEVYERVVVPVRTSTAGGRSCGQLVVPDVGGEQILAICQNRQWSRAWEELISSRCACLLFMRAGSDEVVVSLDWATCFDTYRTVIDAPAAAEHAQVVAASGAPTSDDNEEVQGTVTDLPTQVVLTEWLQFLRRAFTAVVGGSFRPRVGVVVSAWDLVPVDQQPAGPEAYIKDNFPLLHQFMEGNKGQFEFEVFGVSIVAGDLANDEEFKEAYLNGQPRDSGFVVHSLSGQLKESPDITLPVAWALRVLPDVI